MSTNPTLRTKAWIIMRCQPRHYIENLFKGKKIGGEWRKGKAQCKLSPGKRSCNFSKDSKLAGIMQLLGRFQTVYCLICVCDYHIWDSGYCCFLSVSACSSSAFILPLNDVIQVSMPRYSLSAIIIFADIILEKSREKLWPFKTPKVTEGTTLHRLSANKVWKIKICAVHLSLNGRDGWKATILQSHQYHGSWQILSALFLRPRIILKALKKTQFLHMLHFLVLWRDKIAPYLLCLSLLTTQQ